MWESVNNNHQIASKCWEGHVANLMFKWVHTKFIIIYTATKHLGKVELFEAEHVDSLVFYVLRSQGASHGLRADISLGILREPVLVYPNLCGWTREVE